MMEKLSKAKQGFLYGAPFPALAFYKVWAALTPSANSLLLSLLLFAYCDVVVAIAYRWDQPTYFDWMVAAYFVLLSGTLLHCPNGGPIDEPLPVYRHLCVPLCSCLLPASSVQRFNPDLSMLISPNKWLKKIKED